MMENFQAQLLQTEKRGQEAKEAEKRCWQEVEEAEKRQDEKVEERQKTPGWNKNARKHYCSIQRNNRKD